MGDVIGKVGQDFSFAGNESLLAPLCPFFHFKFLLQPHQLSFALELSPSIGTSGKKVRIVARVEATRGSVCVRYDCLARRSLSHRVRLSYFREDFDRSTIAPPLALTICIAPFRCLLAASKTLFFTCSLCAFKVLVGALG